jgi:hypothetical protein
MLHTRVCLLLLITKTLSIIIFNYWIGVKSGTYPDPDRFCVHPSIDIPELKGRIQIAHNVVHDLAMLNNTELLLWDIWYLRFAHEVNQEIPVVCCCL